MGIQYTAKLPLKERLELFEKATKLHKEKGFGPADISHTLKIPYGTASGWLYYGRKPTEERWDLRNVSRETRANSSRDFWNSEKGEKRKNALSELLTGKHDTFYGKHHTKEAINKIIGNNKKRIITEEKHQYYREAGIRRWETASPESKKSQIKHLHRIIKTHREKRIYYIKAHEKEVEKQLLLMKKEGFRAINVSISAKKPDIIAFKDGKIYAVEVETLRRRAPHYGKWEQPNPFDDIIWVIKEAA